MPQRVAHLTLVPRTPPRLPPAPLMEALYEHARQTTQAWCDADLCLPLLVQHLNDLGHEQALRLAYELGVRQGLRQQQGRVR